jgi:hypothetical protein
MALNAYAIPAVILVTLTSLILLVSQDWRVSISALAIQYIGVFILVALNWPLEMAISKLIAGWIAGAVLVMAIISFPRLETEEPIEGDFTTQEILQPQTSVYGAFTISGGIFRLVAAVLVGLTVFSVAPRATEWIAGIQLTQAWGGFILIGMGLLQLGFTAHPFRTIMGLLTALSGFEILYAVAERSTLVAGLLAAVNLGLALVGAYLLVAPFMEETE